MIKTIYTVITMLLIGVITFSQEPALKKNAEVTMHVDGVCMMCKTRIEAATIKNKGVKFASWDVETLQLSMIVDERKVALDSVIQSIADVGHDVGEVQASDAVYQNLHACCKYRDEEQIKNHH